MLVGCKVTLRKNVMENFFDSLLLALPRMENLKVLKKKQFFKNKTLNFFSFALTELFSFYAFELGLGISTEVQKLDLNFIFSTTCVEEKLFLLCSKKIPII
jgi:ribosomal protein L5